MMIDHEVYLSYKKGYRNCSNAKGIALIQLNAAEISVQAILDKIIKYKYVSIHMYPL